DEKVVPQEFHLLDRLFGPHRLNLEAFAADEQFARNLFGLLGEEFAIQGQAGRRTGLGGQLLLATAVENALVAEASNLSFHALDREVDRSVDVAVFLFGTEDRIFGGDGELGDDLFAAAPVPL